MGRDKSRVRLAGRTLLDLSRELPRSLGLRIRVVRRDSVRRCGPLGGVLTAFRRSASPALLFLACDTPFIPPTLAKRLLRLWQSHQKPVFTQQNGLVGFPFLLPRSAGPLVSQQIATGALSLQELARQLKALKIRPAAHERAGLVNINNPETLARARRRVRPPRPYLAPSRSPIAHHSVVANSTKRLPRPNPRSISSTPSTRHQPPSPITPPRP